MEYVIKGLSVLFGAWVIYLAFKTDREIRRIEKRQAEVAELYKFLRKEEAI